MSIAEWQLLAKLRHVLLVGTRFRGGHYGQRLMCAASIGRTHGRTDQSRKTFKSPFPKEGRPHMATKRTAPRDLEPSFLNA
jgi:hypothetical protein